MHCLKRLQNFNFMISFCLACQKRNTSTRMCFLFYIRRKSHIILNDLRVSKDDEPKRRRWRKKRGDEVAAVGISDGRQRNSGHRKSRPMKPRGYSERTEFWTASESLVQVQQGEPKQKESSRAPFCFGSSHLISPNGFNDI